MDWLMRPVLRGMCKFESYLDGRLLLEHVGLMNDALEVTDENARRAAPKGRK